LIAELMARFDGDGDGSLSQEEHRRAAGAEPGFEELDLDRDGLLGPREILAAVQTQDPGCRAILDEHGLPISAGDAPGP